MRALTFVIAGHRLTRAPGHSRNHDKYLCVPDLFEPRACPTLIYFRLNTYRSRPRPFAYRSGRIREAIRPIAFIHDRRRERSSDREALSSARLSFHFPPRAKGGVASARQAFCQKSANLPGITVWAFQRGVLECGQARAPKKGPPGQRRTGKLCSTIQLGRIQGLTRSVNPDASGYEAAPCESGTMTLSAVPCSSTAFHSVGRRGTESGPPNTS